MRLWLGEHFRYLYLQRAQPEGESCAVGCDSFVGRSQLQPNARARIRASGVFRFLPSPLHLWVVSC